MIELTCVSAAACPATFRQAFAHLGAAPAAAEAAAYVEALFDGNEVAKEFWLASEGGIAVGRIAAAGSAVDPTRGYLGVFQVDLEHPAHAEASAALIAAGSKWLRAHGVSQCYAPIDVNTWFRYRLATNEEQAGPTFSWEPQDPPDYHRLFAAAGYTPAATFHSTGFDSEDFTPALTRLAPHYKRALAAGFRFRPLASGAGALKDLRIIYDLAQECFKDSFLFEPIEFDSFLRLYSGSLGRVDHGPSRFVVGPDGEELGFLFAFIDQGYVVSKSVCVRPALLNMAGTRKWAASAALLYLALEYGSTRGLKGGVSALVKDDASSRLLEQRQTWARSWTHSYVLLGRSLGDTDLPYGNAV